MVTTKGFIHIGDNNQYEFLNRILYAAARVCQQNSILKKSRHPFEFVGIEMASPTCFFLRFTHKKEEVNKYRMLQIGFYEDELEIEPKGKKISLSVNSWGDHEFIIKEFLTAANKVTDLPAYYEAQENLFQKL